MEMRISVIKIPEQHDYNCSCPAGIHTIAYKINLKSLEMTFD